MKTKEELNEIKRELEAVSEKIKELTEEELEQVTGGGNFVVGNGIVIGDIDIGDVIAEGFYRGT